MIDKNVAKQNAKRRRVFVSMNTGTITHKSKRDYSRYEQKSLARKAVSEYC